jgi:glycogen debranching enzyme
MARTDVNLYWSRPGELSAYRGHSILVTDSHGRVAAGLEGFFLHRTRFISRLVLKVEGSEPKFVSANPVTPHSLISYHLAPSPAGAAAGPTPDDTENSGGEIAEKGIEVQINRFVGGGLRQDVHVTNHGMAETTVTLAWEVAADFADHTEAQSGKRQQTAPVDDAWTARTDGGELTFRYRHPELDLATTLRFSGSGATDWAYANRGGGVVSCKIALRPQNTRTVGIDIAPVFRGETVEPIHGLDGVPVGDPAAARVAEEWMDGCARLAAANPTVQTAWDRAAADLGSLHLLEGEEVERFTPAAGIPNYIGLFGRDSLMASWQSALLNRETLRGSLGFVARWNAEQRDDRYDAQPGKIIHQRQFGPLATLGMSPFLHYYGDYSAPGLFLLGIATDFAHTGDKDFLLAMRDKALATLEWMDRDGDRDGDGFYEYQTRAGDWGIKNQGWKDSGQAILHEDGRMVPDPIAVCEVQGLYYAAKQAMALAFAALGERGRAADLMAQAKALKQRFNERFWMPDAEFLALALDPDKRQVRSIASNAGSALAYGILDDDKAAPVAERLMASDMFSGWGIRTLSSRHPAFNPLAYHLGTVWPFANALTGYGFKRYGFDAPLHRLANGLFDASELFHLGRLPEVFGGHARDLRHPHPGIYPGACTPQAWSASAVIFLVHAMLGITPLAPARTLIVDPSLPEWLPEVTLEGIRVGQARVDLRFRREASGATRHEVLASLGDLTVHRPEPDASGSGPKDRVAGAIRERLG